MRQIMAKIRTLNVSVTLDGRTVEACALWSYSIGTGETLIHQVLLGHVDITRRIRPADKRRICAQVDRQAMLLTVVQRKDDLIGHLKTGAV
jgi:hypothetical protein